MVSTDQIKILTIYDAICWTSSNTMNLKTTVLQDLQQPMSHVDKNTSKKNPVSPRELPSCSLRFASVFVKMSQNQVIISAVISEIHICVFKKQ